MLESLLSLKELYKRPYIMLPWAFIMASIGTLVAIQVAFPVQVSSACFDTTGLFAVLFTVIPSVYFITLMIKRDELIGESLAREHRKDDMWARHGREILILVFFFLGLTLAFAFWSFTLHDTAFDIQLQKIGQIRGTGAVTGAELSQFNRILFNNLNVMVFSFIFSLIFGAGAVFIIVWNASILGVFVGARLSQYAWDIPYHTGVFLPHGIPEIVGYLFAGLAGGIMSAAVIRGKGLDTMKVVLRDALLLMAFAIFSVLCGAAIEALGFELQVIGMVAFYGVFVYLVIHALESKYSDIMNRARNL
jgi:uncharacterized membrane protein SpoIIM required for sporulation